MENFLLFVKSLFGSWMVWAGAILRLIPFVEQFIEPWLRSKHPKIEAWFLSRGEALKKNLKVIAIVCLLIGCYRAWVFEHKNAETAMYGKDGKAEAWSRFNTCDKALAVKTTLADTLTQTVTTQQGLLGGLQGNFNGQQVSFTGQQTAMNTCIAKLQELTKADALKITAFYVGTVREREEPAVAPYAYTWLVAVNHIVTPVQLVVTCLPSIVKVSGGVMGTATVQGGGWNFPQTSTQVGIGFSAPAWTPANPMLITALSKEKLTGCSFNEQ